MGGVKSHELKEGWTQHPRRCPACAHVMALPGVGPEGQVGSARVSGRPQSTAGQRGVRWGPQVSPAYAFLGSFPGPSIPATDPDPILGTLGALCSGETAHPRAL